MDLQAVLHNKWALGGAAVAGTAGIVVYLRRRAAGGSSSSSSTGAQSSPAYSGGVGGFDSTGTDVAAQLGQYQANTQVILDQYQKQLTDALSGLSQMQPATTGTGPGPAATPAQAGPRLVSIATGENLYQVAQGWGLNWDQFLAWNPQLKPGSGFTWTAVPGQSYLTPKLNKGQQLRVS